MFVDVFSVCDPQLSCVRRDLLELFHPHFNVQLLRTGRIWHKHLFETLLDSDANWSVGDWFVRDYTIPLHHRLFERSAALGNWFHGIVHGYPDWIIWCLLRFKLFQEKRFSQKERINRLYCTIVA